MLMFAALIACPAPEAPTTLVIDGPAEVRVEQFGPLTLPPVVVQKGEVVVEGAAITWKVEPPELGSVADGHVDVRAAGTGKVTATFDAAQGSFALIVAPPITLTFVDPPTSLAVGTSAQLVTGTRFGDQPAVVESAPTFVSSNDAFATVSPTGMVTAVSPGLVYVTGRLGESEAMVEIEVR